MEAAQYLDRLLLRYSGSFNIYKPYRIADREFAAYGYFYNHLEKYVLVRDANLWSSDCFEHVLFVTAQHIDLDTVKALEKVVSEHVEPELVRKNEKLPPKNHMYSYMTVMMISTDKPEIEVIKETKKFHFEKGYMMNIRGYAQTHMCLISAEDGAVYTNYAARKKKKLLREVYKEVKQNKIGFEELCKKQDIKTFQQ